MNIIYIIVNIITFYSLECKNGVQARFKGTEELIIVIVIAIFTYIDNNVINCKK